MGRRQSQHKRVYKKRWYTFDDGHSQRVEIRKVGFPKCQEDLPTNHYWDTVMQWKKVTCKKCLELK